MATEARTMVTKQVLDEMVRRLVAEFDPEQVILFGSYAWGEPSDHSDVDMMVIIAHSDAPPISRMVRAHGCLAGLAVSKDIVVTTQKEFDFMRGARASLESKVADRGKVLYDRRQDTARAGLAHQGA
jgi:predicted nucleotidyltransferase